MMVIDDGEAGGVGSPELLAPLRTSLSVRKGYCSYSEGRYYA